jgi:hypothetical protein
LRYEVGQAENAEPFIEEVLAQFDLMQSELPELAGSFLATRKGAGEAIALLLWENEDDAGALDAFLKHWPAPETGAREVMMGRRAVEDPTPLWGVWQGRQQLKTA